MGKDYGEPKRYDPDFNGPIHNRSCTDIIWLILFVLYVGAWGFLGYYSYTNGNMQALLAPQDSQGNRCGVDASYKDRPHLVFFDIAKCLSPDTPITGCSTPQVCVEQCPTETINFSTQLNYNNFQTMKSKMVCKYDVNKDSMTWSQAQQYIQEEKCAKQVIKSESVLWRCIGDLQEIQKLASALGNIGINLGNITGKIPTGSIEQLSSQIVQDLVHSRWFMVGAVVVITLVCFIYILLLRWIVSPVVWTSLGAFFVVLGFAVYKCYGNYGYYRDHPVSIVQSTNLKGYIQSWLTNSTTWLVILIIGAALFLIIFLIVIFLRSRIVIAIALIREGSKAVFAIKSTVFFPIFPWILQCAVIAYGVVLLMCIMSMGEAQYRTVNIKDDTNCVCPYKEDYVTCDPNTFKQECHNVSSLSVPCQTATCHYTGIENQYSTYYHLANLLGFFWVMAFVSGVADMMLASTFATWYWTFHKKNLPFFTLTAGISRTLCNHLGTVAFGSLIIAIVRVIRVILEYVDHKLKKFNNPLTKCLMCFCRCCFWCLDNFIKFINKNAYIMCAVHGKGFCASARDAFSLLMRNIVRVVVLDKVMDFVFLLSKLLISIGMGFAVYYLLEWDYFLNLTHITRMNYSYIPAAIMGIATLIIATIFFNVYSMAVDTLFLCFLEDCERNDGSVEKPYFMSSNLRSILGKKNKRPKNE